MTADARSLDCPNCGAPAEPEAARCPYCLARLATVSCPSCFARIFDGAAFCPSCGTRRAKVEDKSGDAACPSCREPLRSVDVGGTPLLECETCDGIWVDADVFEGLCASRESQSAVLHRFEASGAVRADARVRYRPCLRCGKMMNRVNFAKMSGTIVDVCRGHGTFLDAGELHAIVKFILSGGMDRTRARQIEDLKEEQRRLQRQQMAAARQTSQDAEASWGATVRWDASDVFSLIDALKRR